jgi:hypothetical protein
LSSRRFIAAEDLNAQAASSGGDFFTNEEHLEMSVRALDRLATDAIKWIGS